MSFHIKVDWNFDNVPVEELTACCFWEYARESKTIGLAAEIHWCHVRDIRFRAEYERNPTLKREHDKRAVKYMRRAKANRFDYDSFSDAFWSSEVTLIRIYDSITSYVRDDACAWSGLSERFRAQLTKEVSESYVLHPLSQSLVGEVETLWKANKEALEWARTNSPHDDSEEAALHAESDPVLHPSEKTSEPPGVKTVAFTVDFTRFTDEEICNEMKKWVAANRSPEWRIPKRVFPVSKQRGRKRSGKFTEYYTALKRLGLMRLLHLYSPNELENDLPEAWAKYGKGKDDFRREVREACKFFRKMFPFLPEKEKPRSAARKGIWFPEVMKVCGRFE